MNNFRNCILIFSPVRFRHLICAASLNLSQVFATTLQKVSFCIFPNPVLFPGLSLRGRFRLILAWLKILNDNDWYFYFLYFYYKFKQMFELIINLNVKTEQHITYQQADQHIYDFHFQEVFSRFSQQRQHAVPVLYNGVGE